MFRSNRPLKFLYSDRFGKAGSTIMRGYQLSQIATAEYAGARRVSYSSISDFHRKADLFLTKGALKDLTPEALADLKRNGNRLYFDAVDELPPPTTSEFADALVASSVMAFTNHSRDYPAVPVTLVNHHVDPRLPATPVRSGEEPMRLGYFGEPLNAIFGGSLESHVDVVHVDTSDTSTAWMKKLPGYTMHYAMRRNPGADNFKPFLKGFTAAHMNANILIQDTEREALEWLGEDYPFLHRGPISEDSILAAIERAGRGVGSSDWRFGLRRMAEIRERTSPKRIGAELRRLFAE
ncbi:hypothetical protein SAMN06295879_1802 [Agreia bicolorata]|uniref:Glycosyl transferases group 1 n=2 Tax=Agreia bicolorata TaxID=110935 RepID=A0A1T4XX41_9MICO|nr:hypothetical protein SAMN06295879_1802 [Agreia bicolorata]